MVGKFFEEHDRRVFDDGLSVCSVAYAELGGCHNRRCCRECRHYGLDELPANSRIPIRCNRFAFILVVAQGRIETVSVQRLG